MSSAADYSRQTRLKEIGAAGQDKLGLARVLVVGAGGLGCPVLQYLAGAGVGCLGVVDSDVLDASNLHRQPLYRRSDVGRPKAALARTALLALNPDITVETHAVRLTADNAATLIDGYDVVVDCTDNFRAKFLINDAAVMAARPAVFASIYQYEGQLQVYQAHPAHACLRCVWREGTVDGVVGNCATAGVLGPIPAAFGALQALLALKILLGLPGQLAGELMLWDLTNFSINTLKAARLPECVAPGCAHVHGLQRDDEDLQLTAIPSTGEYELIDVRTAEEYAERPTPGRHIAMASLLARPEALSREARYLLICATGQRSLAAAAVLDKQGFKVRSLAGGLAAIEGDHAFQK